MTEKHEEKADADRISSLVIDSYNHLGSSGKPMANQWSHFASVLAKLPDGYIKVLSVATGTKCLGETQVSDRGLSINDSHAEVLARRAVMRYLLNEMNMSVSSNAEENGRTRHEEVTIIERHHNNFRVKEGVKFILYTSQTPCGDASIIPCSSSDIYRTGAKCLANEKDPKLPGANYHILGAFRTKPGRGVPTLSMSCTDKILKWLVMGLQGSLLALLIDDPIYIDEIVVGNCPFDESVLRRALVERNSGLKSLFDKDSKYQVKSPKFSQSTQELKISRKRSADSSASSETLVWCANAQTVDVLVDGYKRGMTRKCRENPARKSQFCRLAIAEDVLNLLNSLNLRKESNCNYLELKAESCDYQTTWARVRDHYKDWTPPEAKRKFQHFPVGRL